MRLVLVPGACRGWKAASRHAGAVICNGCGRSGSEMNTVSRGRHRSLQTSKPSLLKAAGDPLSPTSQSSGLSRDALSLRLSLLSGFWCRVLPVMPARSLSAPGELQHGGGPGHPSLRYPIARRLELTTFCVHGLDWAVAEPSILFPLQPLSVYHMSCCRAAFEQPRRRSSS